MLNRYRSKQEWLIDHFKSLIDKGTYKPGDLLPPEISLAKKFGVNRATVSKALGALAGRGILIRRQGSGTYVAPSVAPTSGTARTRPVSESNCPAIASSYNITIASTLQCDDERFRFTPHGLMLTGMEDAFTKMAGHCRVSFDNYLPHLQIDEDFLQKCKRDETHGLIYLCLGVNPELEQENIGRLRQTGCPFVVVSHSNNFPDMNLVSAAQEAFGFLAADALINRGHRKIVYVIPEIEDEWLTRRINGFFQAIKQADGNVEGTLFRFGIHTRHDEAFESGNNLVDTLIEKEPDTTGIIAVNDSYALGMMQQLAQRGINIPQDLSLIGADDQFRAKFSKLTTIRQPYYAIGEAAAVMLLKKLDPSPLFSSYDHWQIKPTLIERMSVADPQPQQT